MGCESIFVSMDDIDPRGPFLIQAKKHRCLSGKFSADLVQQACGKGKFFSYVLVFEHIMNTMSDSNVPSG